MTAKKMHCSGAPSKDWKLRLLSVKQIAQAQAVLFEIRIVISACVNM